MHKIAEKEALTISSHSHSYIRTLLCCSVDKSWILLIPYSVIYMIFTMAKIYVNFNILSAVNIIKFTTKKIRL